MTDVDKEEDIETKEPRKKVASKNVPQTVAEEIKTYMPCNAITQVNNDFRCIPPENHITDMIREMKKLEDDVGTPYCVLYGDRYFDRNALEMGRSLHRIKVLKSDIAYEDEWLLRIVQGPQILARDLAIRLISMIQDKPEDHVYHSCALEVKHLCKLVGTRWMSDALISRIATLINMLSDDTYACYFNFEHSMTALANKIRQRFKTRNPSRIVLGLNVGIDNDETFLGHKIVNDKTLLGHHFSSAIYDFRSNTLSYGDSKGWPIPSSLKTTRNQLAQEVEVS